jgi:ABC-type transport system substrate-binding protein
VEAADGSVTVEFTLREGLVWSDGVAFSPSEIAAYVDIIMEEGEPDDEGNPTFVFPFADRTGIDTITSVDIVSETEFSITWSMLYSGWQGIMPEVPPMHVWEGLGAADVNTNWGNFEVAPGGDKLPSTGPMILEEWNPGISVVMSRNATYHGNVSPDAVNRGIACVDGMIMSLVPDTDTQINALKAGEAHIIHPQPQLAFEQLSDDPRFVSAVAPGPI